MMIHLAAMLPSRQLEVAVATAEGEAWEQAGTLKALGVTADIEGARLSVALLPTAISFLPEEEMEETQPESAALLEMVAEHTSRPGYRRTFAGRPSTRSVESVGPDSTERTEDRERLRHSALIPSS